MTNIKDVAKAAGVSTATVSAVINETAYVSPELKSRVTAAIEGLDYAPKSAARNLKRGRSQLIALVVSDLQNPFFSRVVCLAEAAASAWGYNLVVFNSDEKPENEKKILSRIRSLSCDGIILVPISPSDRYDALIRDSNAPPIVLLGREIESQPFDTVTLDNEMAGLLPTRYLMDIGHTRIGTITGPTFLSTGQGRLHGVLAAMKERGLSPASEHIRSGGFREEIAYSVAIDMMKQPNPPTALYVGNGLMALGVMRALNDCGLRCPDDLSIASTDALPWVSGLRPRLTRTEHPLNEMIDQALRFLMDRISGDVKSAPRRVVFSPDLILGGSCAPPKAAGARGT